jgi:hypothetical protein
LDKRPLSFDYQSVFKINGLYELPLGKGKWIGGNASGWLDRIIGGWELGAVGLFYPGRPLTLTAQNTINTVTGTVYGVTNTAATALGSSAAFAANALGALPGDGVTRIGNGVIYFAGLKQVTDPAVANLIGSQLKAITTSNGALLLVNPLPGQLGNLGQGVIRGPGAKNLNVNLIKHIRVNERVTLQLGATAENVTNTPIFNDPDMNINSPTFGRITSTATSPAGNRIVVLQGRVNF